MEEIKNWGGNHQDGHSVDEKVCGLKRTKFIVHLTFHKNKKKERSIVSVIGYRIRICSTIREGITCRAYVNEICHLRLTIVLLLNCGKYFKKKRTGLLQRSWGNEKIVDDGIKKRVPVSCPTVKRRSSFWDVNLLRVKFFLASAVVVSFFFLAIEKRHAEGNIFSITFV